jgi:hypothetical protein
MVLYPLEISNQQHTAQKYDGKTPIVSEIVIFINIFMLVTHEINPPENRRVREFFPTFVTLFNVSYLFDLQ